MPKTPTSQNRSNGSPARAGNYSADVTWVNYTLTEEHKKALEKVMKEKPELLELELAQAAQEGYRWSISWDSYAGCFSVVMFTRDTASSNSGLMMSSRSKSWYKALLMCMYKHLFVFEQKWIVADEQERDWEG